MGHFYFVRHGQTIWNVENKICGATDIALTEFGHQQAIETGRKILAEGIKADEILYSPLIRAADTARHISETTGIPARVEPRLTEQRFGKWEATARNGEAFKKAKECFACSHEGGESTLLRLPHEKERSLQANPASYHCPHRVRTTCRSVRVMCTRTYKRP